MDGNKDDALKCLKIGKEALESGDRARALKFVAKARRLDPNLQVDDLLSKIEGQSDSRSESTNTNEGPIPDRSGPSQSDQQRPSVRHRGPSTGSSSASATYTEEQISIVRQIRKKKDLYEILGVERSCTVEDVRKAYRKLSLKVHPDKNKAPGAEEAFKAVSKAFQCLSDAESRKKYDVTGSDEPVHVARAARRGPAQGFNGFYEAEFDADEIFRNFFFGGGGGMHPATTQYRGFSFGTGMGPRQTDNASSGFNLRMLIQLLPVILILLLNFLPSSDPIYSLSRSYPYEYKYTTQKGVNYYVKSTSKFDQDYPPDSYERARLEMKIDRDYISILAQNCRVEMQRRQWGFVKEMPHCDMLQKFDAAA